MLHQEIPLGFGSWRVLLYYDVGVGDFPSLLRVLSYYGNSPRQLSKFVRVFSSGLNKGYTYSHFLYRVSICVIGRSSSRVEFFNTVLHELKHVVEHICSYFHVSPSSEESAYLQGYLGSRMYPYLRSLLLC